MSALKECSMCKNSWGDIEAILQDDELIFCGYQPFFPDPAKSLLLFIHEKEDCGTTIGFHLSDFQSVVDYEISFSAFVAGEALDCEGRCLNNADLGACNSKTCPGAAVRNLIQYIKEKSVENKKYLLGEGY